MTAATSRWSTRTRRVAVVLAVVALGTWAGPASAGDGSGNGNGSGGPPPQAGPPADPGNGSGNGNAGSPPANGHENGGNDGKGNGSPGEHGNAVGNPHGPTLDSTGDPVVAVEDVAAAPELPEATEPSEPEVVENGDAEAGVAPEELDVPLSEPGVVPAPEAAPEPPPAPAPKPKPKPQSQQPQPNPPSSSPAPPRALPSAAPRWTSPVPVSVPSPQGGVLGRFASAGSEVDVVRGVNGAHGVRVVGNADGRFSLTTAAPIVAGRTPYRAAAWLRTDTPGVTVCLRVMEKTSGRKSRLVRSAETCVSPTATWQRFRVQALAIAPGNVLRISAVVYGGFDGAAFELSRLKVERKVAGRWTKVRGALLAGAA